MFGAKQPSIRPYERLITVAAIDAQHQADFADRSRINPTNEIALPIRNQAKKILLGQRAAGVHNRVRPLVIVTR